MFLLELLAEIIFQAVVYFVLPYVCCLPGACIRWCFLRGKVPVKQLLYSYFWFNILLSMLFYTGLFFVFYH